MLLTWHEETLHFPHHQLPCHTHPKNHTSKQRNENNGPLKKHISCTHTQTHPHWKNKKEAFALNFYIDNFTKKWTLLERAIDRLLMWRRAFQQRILCKFWYCNDILFLFLKKPSPMQWWRTLFKYSMNFEKAPHKKSFPFLRQFSPFLR